MEKTCPICKTKFQPKSSRSIYCNRDIERACSICGKIFVTKCNPDSPEVCSRTCANKHALTKKKVCSICGDEFVPNSTRQLYCKHLKPAICPICGKEYQYECCPNPDKTCGNKKCRDAYAHNQTKQFYLNTTKICEWCGKEFHPTTNTSKFCSGPHFRKCDWCGKEYEVDLTIEDYRKTCSIECAKKLRFKNGNPFQREDCRQKAYKTCLERYGVEHPMQSEVIKQKVSATYEERTGYKSPMHNPEHRSKIAKSAKTSTLETRVSKLLQEYKIDYEWHKIIKNEDGVQHEFDFFIPKYNILVDCDGLFYHSYISDPNGKQVLDCYDELRIAILPKDATFVLIVEGQEEQGVKRISKIISKMDSGVFDYEGELFTWCRRVGFPYPQYSDERLVSDFKSLCNYQTDLYRPNARLGDSIVNQFHRSMFDCRVDDYISPKEAWYDDKLLKKVILNRLIYINDVDPYKVLKGFNISKICPKVSVFNPVLARYLVSKYLNDFNEVFDPFSGFSGRLIGTVSTGKTYIGQDLNVNAVKESNEIIEHMKFEQCQVNHKDILESSGSYECLLTCPPYGRKEIYSTETVFKPCDEWIDECLDRFKCKRYVFVVDETERYINNVVENIVTSSHFNAIKEYVIVIDKN